MGVITCFHTNFFQGYLSECLVCVRVCVLVLIYIYVGVSFYWSLGVLYVFVCVISNHSTSKKPRV